MLVFLSSVSFAGATVIDFDLSPTGTSAAVGLSPANENPAAVTSTGSGNEISGGITFDTATSTLSFAMGYGSAAGFTKLTGAATGAHIHGPAAVGANAAVLFDLATVHFPAAVPANGGVIYGSVIYTPSQAADLLAGLDYVNVHTAANPNGEIRGQLVRVNVAPEIVCAEAMTVECGVAVTYNATVSDFDGNAVQVVWSVNGTPVQTNNIAAGGPPSSAVLGYTTKLHEGSNIVTVTATDSGGEVTTCDTVVTAEDTTAPVIKSLSVNPKVLWPPNHKMVAVSVDALVSDACGSATWRILSVRSNEEVGKTSPDWVITGAHKLSLRSERSGKNKEGRIYTIKVQATDEAGNTSETETVTVTVPHDQGK